MTDDCVIVEQSNKVKELSVLKKLTYSYPMGLYVNEDNKDDYFNLLNREYFKALPIETDISINKSEDKVLRFDDEEDSVLVFDKTANIESKEE